jgi:serine/threonine protein kinase
MMRRMPILPSSPLLTSLCGVQHRVGSGRLGTVYRATHLETDRPVALRVLSEPVNGDHGLRLAWWREARQAAGLRHPNVAAVYRAGAIQRSEEGLTPFPVGSLWLASEWLEGPALSSQRLAFADVVPIVSSLLRALAHLHARGYRHGAVRARNLRCSTPGGAARLCDMGMDRIDALVHESSDLASLHGPVVTDLASVAVLVSALVPAPRPPGVDDWIAGLRGVGRARPFTHSADARLAWEALTGVPSEAPVEDASNAARYLNFDGAPDPWPLVGRGAERELLDSALRRVRAEGRPRAVVLSGPPGVGRDALASALSTGADELGLAWSLVAWHGPFSTRGHGLGGMMARFLGCDGMVPPLSRIRAETRLQDLGVDAEFVRRFVAVWVEDGSGRVPASPVEQAEVLQGLLERLSREKPVILRLDEAHWSQDALALADHLLSSPQTTSLPVLLVLTVRSDLVPRRPAEEARLRRLLERPHCGLVTLGPLGMTERRALLEDQLHFLPSAATRLAEASLGSPLYLHEVHAQLRATGGLRRPARGEVALTDEVSALPSDVDVIWQRRLHHLLDEVAPGSSDAVEIAAVLGGLVDAREWREICAKERANIDPGLVDLLFHEGLAQPIPRAAPGAWRFSHGLLVRAIIHRAARGGRLASHHRAVARYLESLPEDKHPARRARPFRHRLAAGEVDKVFETAVGLVRSSLAGGLLRAALELTDRLERAIDVAGDGPEAVRRAWLWALRAEARTLEGASEQAWPLIARTEATSRRFGWSNLLALSLVLRVRAQRAEREPELTRKRLIEAEALLERGGPAWLRARVRMEAARLALEQGDWEGAADELAEARPLWEEARDPVGVAHCWLGLSRLAALEGDSDVAARRLEAAMHHFESAGAWLGVAEAHALAGDQLRHGGSLEPALARYSAGRRIVDALGLPGLLDAELGEALVEVGRGDWRQARRLLVPLLDRVAGGASPVLEAGAQLGLAACAAGLHDRPALDRHLDAARQSLRDSDRVDIELALLAERVGELSSAIEDKSHARRAWRLAASQLRGLGRVEEAARAETLSSG